MAIDSCGTRSRHSGRTAIVSKNAYKQQLVDIYAVLARRTGSAVCQKIHKRLMSPIKVQGRLSLYKLLQKAKSENVKAADKIITIVGSIVDDAKLTELPSGLKFAALRCTETARQRIEKAGGEFLTLDQLALRDPKGDSVYLTRFDVSNRMATRYFGVPGGNYKPALCRTNKTNKRNEV